MSKGITQENMLTILPGVLAKDDGMYELAQLVGWVTGSKAGDVDAPAMFQNIDSMSEDLLDLLARDCKVDWYDCDADIETKRRQFKNNWFVRKKIGTVSAVRQALQDVWPDTEVEEWFDYGGDPGYFKVLLSLDTQGTVPFTKAMRMVELFKPARSHLDGYPVLRVRCGIVIRTSAESIEYHVPVAGTIPRYSTHGNLENGDLTIWASSDPVGYTVRKCGTSLNALF